MTTTPLKSKINVSHRNGDSTPLDISKIRDVINCSVQGINVNKLKLESKLNTRLKDGVTTKEIQTNLIDCALTLCSETDPQWRYVAGRLHIWDYTKDVINDRGFDYHSYIEYLNYQVNRGVYSDDILSNYTYDELAIAGSWIDKSKDKDYDYAGSVLFTNRYLLDNELIQECYLTIALLLCINEPDNRRLQTAWMFYLAFSDRRISLATPILANLRVPNGSLSSCFIIASDDNLESIFDQVKNAANISKKGGGVGVNLSRIRAKGSSVMGNFNASCGVVPWIKIFNDTAIAVNQGGRRSGAITVGLDIWHLDVTEFLEMQTEHGDQRRKAYDVFPQLVIPDKFMECVKNDEHWYLVDPHQVKVELGIDLATLWGDEFNQAYERILSHLDSKITLYKRIKAKDLIKQIMRSQLETGMPYLAYKDTINRANPNKHLGYIPGVNLCCESFSNVKPDVEAHCCNLVSLNYANLRDTEVSFYCGLAVRILDNTIDITSTPITEAKIHNDKYRTIGVGIMGLSDYMAKNHIKYEDHGLIENILEQFSYYCIKASCELAKVRGAYDGFEGSEWSKGLLANSIDVNDIDSNNFDWEQLAIEIKKYGIRNSHIMAIAPTTSSSLIQGCTASVLPTYSNFFYDKWGKGIVPVAPPFIDFHKDHYQENKTLNQDILVKAISVMQKWIDTGISMELLFNLNQNAYGDGNTISSKDIYNTLLLSWELGCKAVYYVRTVQKDDSQKAEETIDCGCTG